jgi:RNA polymerase sigma-70 factor (ECF subfamily)
MSGDSEVDDVAQESLVAVLRGLPTYRAEGRFEAWVDRIAARTTFAALKKRRALRVVGTDEPPDAPDEGGDPEEYLQRRRLVAVLDELPEKQRSAIVLHFVMGMSVPEIAVELDAPEETVRSRLRLGMAHLRERMQAGGAHVVGK